MNPIPSFLAPSRRGSRHPWALLLLLLMLPLRGIGSEVWQINLVGDMYDDGRKFAPPTPDKPAFYYPIVAGFTELGPKVAGEPPPSAKIIVHDLAVTLAAQGYRASREVDVPAPAGSATPTVKALQPSPSLILVLHWGALRPEKLDLGGDVTSSNPPPVLNQNQMVGLLAGRKFDSIVDFGVKTEEIWDGVQDPRFFVMVSAYDFDAYNQKHKKVRLWVAKMSMPSMGVTMAEAMPSLIKAGAGVFGRETIGPKVIDVPNAPEGKVEVGTPTVVEPKK